jgi:nucleoside-diphosphate-sugar epimerase
MNVLVLGSEGLVGTSLCNELKRNGYTVIHWDISLSVDHDLSNIVNIQKLKHVIDKVDFVFFLAYDVGGAKYISDVNFSFINRNIMIMFNTFNLLENKSLSLLRVRCIIWKVFMVHSNTWVSNILHTLVDYLHGFGNVYGPEPYSERSHVITDMIHKWKKNGYIDLMTSGEEERQFLHTDDCARCLITVMEKYDEILKSSKYVDITSFEWSKINEVAKLICDDVRVTDIKITTHDRKNEPNSFILKYWKPVISLSEGITSLRLDSRYHTL